jgi:hypothetical protein
MFPDRAHIRYDLLDPAVSIEWVRWPQKSCAQGWS